MMMEPICSHSAARRPDLRRMLSGEKIVIGAEISERDSALEGQVGFNERHMFPSVLVCVSMISFCGLQCLSYHNV